MKTRKVILFVFFLAVSFASNAEIIKALSAGIGQEDRPQHEEFSTKLVFFVEGGPYLANVKVDVFEQQGASVYSGVSKGPWFFIDLPEGKYYVIATRENGDEQGIRFSVEAGQTQNQFALMFPLTQK